MSFFTFPQNIPFIFANFADNKKNNNESMLAKIELLLQEIEGLQASNAEELEAVRIKYLSK